MAMKPGENKELESAPIDIDFLTNVPEKPKYRKRKETIYRPVKNISRYMFHYTKYLQILIDNSSNLEITISQKNLTQLWGVGLSSTKRILCRLIEYSLISIISDHDAKLKKSTTYKIAEKSEREKIIASF